MVERFIVVSLTRPYKIFFQITDLFEDLDELSIVGSEMKLLS